MAAAAVVLTSYYKLYSLEYEWYITFIDEYNCDEMIYAGGVKWY